MGKTDKFSKKSGLVLELIFLLLENPLDLITYLKMIITYYNFKINFTSYRVQIYSVVFPL